MGDEEIGILHTKCDLIAFLTQVVIAKWRESSEEKRTRGWKMRDGEPNMRNRH